MIRILLSPFHRIKIAHIFASNILFISALFFTQDTTAIYIQMIVGILIIFHDIDDKYIKKSLERTINKLQEQEQNLEKKIEEELQKNEEYQKKLFEQQRMAQMGEMISMIAHQWRQPLGAISATSIDLSMKLELEVFDIDNLDGRKEASAYFKKSLKQIDTLVQSLTTTIDDFKNFYKPNKTKELLSVNKALEIASSILSANLNSNRVKVKFEYLSSDELFIHTNELMQVFLSILQNALDNFIAKKIQNPTIKIKTFDTQGAIFVEICDNGGGIDEDVINKIFDPYFSTKDEKNGTGLGLYMSKIIIEEHHDGKIWVENTEGSVCFMIELKREDK